MLCNHKGHTPSGHENLYRGKNLQADKIIPQNKRIFLALAILTFFLLNINSVFALTYQNGSDLYGLLVDSGNTNITGALNLTFQMTTCSFANCSDADWSESYSNSSFTSMSSLNNASFFQYKATFFTENQNYTPYLFNVTIVYTYLDETPPLIDFVSPTPANNSGASGSFVINVSITEENLKNITYNWNGALTTFNSSNESLTDLGSGNWIFTYTQSGLVVGQSYTYNVSVSDYAGNTNSTETRTIKGNTAPSFASVSWTPSSNDSMDPNVEISVTANVSDADANFNYSILQWRNSTETGWNNVTMDNTTAKGLYTSTNGNFTLPSYEDNITMRVLAIDSVDESGVSANYTLKSTWDCTWSVEPSELEEVVGFYQDKFVGNITLINTGDINHSNNECSISFSLGSIGWASEYTGIQPNCDNWNNQNCQPNYLSFYPRSPVTVNASTNQTVEINASFPSTDSPFTETPRITITSSINDSVTGNKTSSVSSTLVIARPNPLVYQKIETYPTTYVSLTPGNFSLESYVKNLGYDSDNALNTTAHNVSFNYTLDVDISSRILEGNETSFYELLNTSTRQYNNLTIGLTSSNLVAMPKGNLNVTIYSYGYKNDSGSFSLIENSGGDLILNETISIEFLCYSEEDKVCVSSCGVGVDPDCSTATTTSSSGGGGGGGAGTGVEEINTAADYQLIRGEDNEVKIEIENKDLNQSITNIEIKVSGDIAKYVEIIPKTIKELKPLQKFELTLLIKSTSYIELGRQELIIYITGKKGANYYNERKKITLEIHELTGETAEKLLQDSKNLIMQLEKLNLSYSYLYDVLNESLAGMAISDYETVRDNYNFINEQVTAGVKSYNAIIELEELLVKAKEKGIDIRNTERLVKLARLSLDRREFLQAYERAKEAQVTYALEVKGEFGKLTYYLEEYPLEISTSTLLLLLFSFGTYRVSRLQIIKKKIKKLKEEEKLISQLTGVIQKETFIDNKMSMEEYRVALEQYQKRLSEIIQKLIELETKRAFALKLKPQDKRLRIEKDKILSMTKELQGDYLQKGKIETTAYNLKLESYHQRLTEIDEKLSLIEAKRAIKSGFGLFKIFKHKRVTKKEKIK